MATVYVPGPSLTDAVEDNGPLPVKSVLALAAGLAEALQAIHRVGLVHRDLKPSNVLLATDGPRVIDFGISLALERSMMTATGMVMGSPGFMSPEQARGQREVGAPTDVFSLGAVLAFAATGSSPFGVGPTPALLYRVVNEVPDLAAVPDRLSPLIEQCLAKDPADRPTPAEVLALLGDDVEVLTGEWLPPAIAETMNRYSPTLSDPAAASPQGSGGDPGGTRACSGRVSCGRIGGARGGRRAAFPRPGDAGARVPAAGASGPVGYEPTSLAPVIPAAAAAGASGPTGYEATSLAPVVPAAAALESASATRVEHGLLPETSLVPVSGPFTAAGRDIPGGTGGPPPGRRPSAFRRWRWLLTAAAAVVVVAVVAVLLTSHSGGGSKVGVSPTASLAGDTTRPPATPTATGPSSKAPSKRPTTAPASQSTGFTQGTQPSATASSTATSSPTATATSSPTHAATPTPTPTTSTSPTATPTTSPTPTATTTTTTPTATPTASSTTAPSASPTA